MKHLTKALAIVSVGLALYLWISMPLKENRPSGIREVGELADELKTNKETLALSKRLNGIEARAIEGWAETRREKERLRALCIWSFLLMGTALGVAGTVKSGRA